MGHKGGRIFFSSKDGKEKWWTKDGRRRRRVDAFVDYSQRKGRFLVSLGIIILLQDQKFICLTSNPTMFVGGIGMAEWQKCLNKLFSEQAR